MKAIFICTMLLMLSACAYESVQPADFSKSIAALESVHGGKIGVYAINTANNQKLGYRSDERFAMCSTHKMLLVAAVLSRVDKQKDSLDRLVKFSQSDIQSYAPIAKQHLEQGAMSVADLSAATIQYSDNTTATLLLKSIGGPKAFNRYMQSLGDRITRLDRYEPEINTNIPLDPRDTTTPSAITNSMHKLLVGNALSANSKELLLEWLIGNTTGDKKLRAGINPNWKVGDKTGSGENGASSDVAIVWPTDSKPWLIAVYYTDAKSSPDQQSAVIAQVGKIIGDTFSSSQ